MSYAIRGEKYRMHNNILSACWGGKVLKLYRDTEREREGDDHNAAAVIIMIVLVMMEFM